MIKKISILLSAVLMTLAAAMTEASAQQYDIESIKVEGDGSITLRVTGNGRNRADAIELAKKNAVYDVIFKGITKGVATGRYTRPLLPVVNAREKYQEYFDIFFMDGGEFLKYASTEDKRAFSDKTKRSKIQVKSATTVRVLIPELRARLISDGVLKTDYDD